MADPISGAITGAASNAASSGIMGGLSNLLGSNGMKMLFDTLGSEGFANLIKGGTALYNAKQTGDMMDFSKDMMNKQENRNQQLFNNDQEDRQRMQNLDFTSGIY